MTQASTLAAAQRSQSFVLTDSLPLRLLTLVMFYFTQGFPIGLFYFALPAWLASNGVSTAAIASVVGSASLPWTLKIINGFLVDRYTFLPMGRRRVWIIGAQSLLVLTLVAGAVIAPLPTEVALLAVLGFCANAAVTFQDAGIDSLAIDIMPEEERARAGGIMCGAQLLGISLTTAAAGWLLTHHGIAACLWTVAAIPAMAMLYAIVIRERAGEKRLPWSAGASHPANIGIQIEAWRPLLASATRAVLHPLSLLLLPVLFVRAMPDGGFEAFHPVLYKEQLGWSPTQYTTFISTLTLASGLIGLLVGGWAVEKIGAQRSAAIALALGVTACTAMGLAEPLWHDARVVMGFQIVMEAERLIFFIAGLTLAMRMCNPSVAATQFTIYMAVSNFGRPTGAALAASTAGAGNAPLFYFSLAGVWALALLLVLKVRYPDENRAQHRAAEALPQGEGPAPEFD
jgi:PAT family beta-lactamase induction signal transducer AmpG